MSSRPALVAATESGNRQSLAAVLKASRSRLTGMQDEIVAAFKVALLNDFLDCAELLLEAAEGSDCNLDECLPLAAKLGCDELCQRMLAMESMDIESHVAQHALVQAAAAGRTELLLALLRKGVSPGAEGGLALRAAAASGNEDIVRILLRDPRIDVAARDNSALVAASAAGQAAVVQLLLAKSHRGVTPLAQKGAAVVQAAQRGHMQIVKQLLASVPDEGVPDGQLLALHECLWEACRCGETLLVKRILKHPLAQPAARDNLAIRIAAAMHNSELVKLLLAYPGVNPSAGGHMVLAHACFVGDAQLLTALLKDPRLTIRPDDAAASHQRMWQRWDARDAARDSRSSQPHLPGDSDSRDALAESIAYRHAHESTSPPSSDTPSAAGSAHSSVAEVCDPPPRLTGRIVLGGVDDAQASRLWPTEGMDMFGCHKQDLSLAAPVRAAAAGNHSDIITKLHRRELYERMGQAQAAAAHVQPPPPPIGAQWSALCGKA